MELSAKNELNRAATVSLEIPKQRLEMVRTLHQTCLSGTNSSLNSQDHRGRPTIALKKCAEQLCCYAVVVLADFGFMVTCGFLWCLHGQGPRSFLEVAIGSCCSRVLETHRSVGFPLRRHE